VPHQFFRSFDTPSSEIFIGMLNVVLDKVMMVKEPVEKFVTKGTNGQLTFRQ
jgi:hypothetical protein